MGWMSRVAAVAAALLAAALYRPYARREAYVAGGLAPRGGGLLKDVAAYALCCIPWAQRTLRPDRTPAAETHRRLEGFHTELQFNSVAGHKMRDSPYFAENFYFWANPADRTDLLFTTRLSFTGVGAAKVVPWFTFLMDGEVWSLPDEFEARALPHDEKAAAMVAEVPGLGREEFTCVEPMREWRLVYAGALQSRSGGRRNVTASLSFSFTPRNVFVYQIHWDEMVAARAMAAKTWDGPFWTNLRSQAQERYMSQAVEVKGAVRWEGEAEVELPVMRGSRDHNFGSRNWRFLWRYIWWPGVKFDTAFVIDGVEYTYFTGSFAEYGNTFENMVVGGLMSDDGACASFSGATPMRDIAPDWYSAVTKPYAGIGEKTIPGKLEFQISIMETKYVLDVKVERGTPEGLWSHAFMMQDGTFEVHEALTKWYFELRASGSAKVLQKVTALGLLEFGGNIVGLDDSI